MTEIVKWPDPRLEQRAEPVPFGERCRELIEDMYTSLGPRGIGLAAPQIGVMKRVIVVNVPSTHPSGNRVKFAVINPVISWVKGDANGMVEDKEGCLSFPGIEVSIPRFMRITVRGYDVKWNIFEANCKNLVARVVQHEIDHLEGRTLAYYGRIIHEMEQKRIAEANASVEDVVQQ